MSKFGIVVACRDHKNLRLHLTSHLQYTTMRDVAFFIVPLVSGDARARIGEAVNEFRASAPIAVQTSIRLLDYRGPSYTGHAVHAGAEAAARAEDCDVLIFAGEATIVGPLWREILEQDLREVGFASGGRVGLVGARSVPVKEPPSPEDSAPGSEEPAGQGEEPDPEPAVFPWPRIVTFFAAVPAASYFDAGGFDTELPANCASDDTLCIRLLRKGYHNFVSRCFVTNLARPKPRRRGPGKGRGAPDSVELDARRGLAWFQEQYPDREEVVRRELEWTGFR